MTTCTNCNGRKCALCGGTGKYPESLKCGDALNNAQYRYTNRIAQKQSAAKEKEIKESGRETVHVPASF